MSVGTERGWASSPGARSREDTCSPDRVPLWNDICLRCLRWDTCLHWDTCLRCLHCLRAQKTYRCKPLYLIVFRQPRIERRVVRPGTHKSQYISKKRPSRLVIPSLRSRAGSERSEGSVSGERSFAALRMTILHRLRLTRKTSYLKCIAHKGPSAPNLTPCHYISRCPFPARVPTAPSSEAGRSSRMQWYLTSLHWCYGCNSR